MRIEAHLAEKVNRIEVRMFGNGSKSDAYTSTRKAVSASRYVGQLDNGCKFWYPLSADKCVEMREVWGKDLKVHKALGDWYRKAAALRAAQVARTTQTDAELPALAAQYPKLNAWLKGDQRVTAAWIANAYRNGGLLADEVGTGKTAGVVAGLVEADITGPTLIVCPKISVRAVWLKELRAHTDIPVYACSGSRKAREKTITEFLTDPSEFKVLVVVAEMLRIRAIREKGRITEELGFEYPALFPVRWSAVVIDESHKVLGGLDVVKGNLAGEGIKRLSYTPNSFKLAVSATPFGKGGKVEALFGTLHWLWPDEFTSKWAWLGRYFEVYDEKVFIRGGRGATKPVKRIGALQNEAGLWRDLGPRVLRRTMEEVSPEHRGLKNWIEIPCELDGPQLAQYRRFADNAELAVEGGIISTVGVLDFLTRCRQFANGQLRKEGGRVVYTGYSAKIDRLLAHLADKHPGRKVVIASQYNEFLDAVQARLHAEGYGTYRLDGSTTEKRRNDMMNAFQGDPTFTGPDVTCRNCQVGRGKPHGAKCLAARPELFLLNTQAGGVSITLDAADELHALDEADPDTMTQLFGRIFRRGRAHEVFFYTYRAMGTIDEELGLNVADRQEKQRRLLDGRRGIEYARQIAKYKKES